MKKLFATLGLFLCFSSSVFAVDVNVYYYWRHPRCTTCTKFETYTQNAVRKMNDPAIHYKSINLATDNSAIKKYNLYTRSIIISKTQNGKEQWKNLDKIWYKVGNAKDYENYIIQEIKYFKGVK